MTINYRFLPWIGSNYFSDGLYGKKILILGESHYISTPVSDHFTIEIIENQINNKQVVKFFNKIERLLSNHEQTFHMSQTDRDNFWNKVVFYNYIQEPFNKPREKVLPSHWNNPQTINCFHDVIEETNPDILIIFGKRLGQNIKHPLHYNYKIFQFMHPSSLFFRFRDIRKILENENFFSQYTKV